MKWLALKQSRVAIQHDSEHNSVLLIVFYVPVNRPVSNCAATKEQSRGSGE